MATMPVLQDVQIQPETRQEVYRRLGIRPFDLGRVAQWKNEKLRMLRKTSGFWARHPEMTSFVLNQCLAFAVLALGASAACSVFIIWVSSIGHIFWDLPFAPLHSVEILFGSIAALFMIVGGAFLIHRAAGGERYWQWSEVPHRYFRSNMPRSARELAVELEASLPGVQITVDKLEKDGVIADPFLVLRSPEDHYQRADYLKCWDEHGQIVIF